MAKFVKFTIFKYRVLNIMGLRFKSRKVPVSVSMFADDTVLFISHSKIPTLLNMSTSAR